MANIFPSSRYNFILPVLAVIGIACSALILKYSEFPYVWISLYWTIFFIFATLLSAGSWRKAICYNLTFLVIFVGILESISAALSLRDHTRHTGKYKTGHYFTANDILGYAPQKGERVDSKKYKGKELIYDVKYTINTNGLRLSTPLKPADSNQNLQPCSLFFGGSYTFGEGVNDFETMPYFVSQLSKTKTYNFGFHGYGPHQMLSAIEHDMIDQIVDCSPSVIVYQTLPTHIARSAGRSPWDKHGPKYILSQDSVKYVGAFDDKLNASIKIIKMLLGKSVIYKEYFANRTPANNEKDVKLFLKIVTAARKKIIEKYPESSFHIIFWDEPLETEENLEINKRILEGLKERGLNFHLISNILPNYLTDKSTYEISPHDKHPNALAHRHIAQYIIDEIH